MNKAVKKYVSRTCPKCGKVYLLGKNGICSGCDKCMKVVRDHKGYAWKPGEKAMETTKGAVQRKAVFKKGR